MPSETRTPWAVHCMGIDPTVGAGPCTTGPIYLTDREYEAQLIHADATWRCPKCRGDAWWDDDNYETDEQEEAL